MNKMILIIFVENNMNKMFGILLFFYLININIARHKLTIFIILNDILIFFYYFNKCNSMYVNDKLTFYKEEIMFTNKIY